MSKRIFTPALLVASFMLAATPLHVHAQSSSTSTSSETNSLISKLKHVVAQDKTKLSSDLAKLKQASNTSTDQHFNHFMQNHPELSSYRDRLRQSAHNIGQKTNKQDADSAFEAAKQKMKAEWSSL